MRTAWIVQTNTMIPSIPCVLSKRKSTRMIRLLPVFLLFAGSACSKRTISDALLGNQLGPPPCSSTFGFAPPLGPTSYRSHQIDFRIERQRCDASALGKNAAVEKVVEVAHLSSTTKPPGEGQTEIRIDLLWRIGGVWSRIRIDGGDFPSDEGYAGSVIETEFAKRRFEVAEDSKRVAIVELPSEAKVPGRAWIVERASGKPVAREVPDAPSAATLLANP